MIHVLYVFGLALFIAWSCRQRSGCSHQTIRKETKQAGYYWRVGATYVHVMEALLDFRQRTVVSDILVDLNFAL